MPLLRFTLDDCECALDISRVDRVYRAAAIKPVLAASLPVLGAVNLHGVEVPAASLRACLGLAPKPLEPAAHFILSRVAGRPVILVADELQGVFAELPGQAEAAEARPDGIERLVDGTLLIRDLDRLLDCAAANLEPGGPAEDGAHAP